MNVFRKLLAASFLVACLAPCAAHAANYGAVYYPSLGPTPPALPGSPVETFLDGITPGKTYSVKVGVTNAGTMTWVAGGANPFRLAYHWTGPAPEYNGQRTDLPHDVLPGETVYLDATLLVPSVPGTYTLQWDMVQENVTWFSNQGVPTEDQIVGVGGKVGEGQPGGDVLYETEYCKWTDCSPEPVENCTTPTITSGPKIIQQESFVWVLGCGYGPESVLSLILPTSNMTVKLPIDERYPGLLASSVPASLIALDQGAFLRVNNPGGVQSNDWPVKFVSTKEIVLLPQSKINIVKCSSEADYNWCNDAFSIDPNVCCAFDTFGFGNPANTFSTIESLHETDGSLFGDSGKDVYSVSLAKGWTLHDMDFSVQILNGGGSVDQPVGFVKGASSATITVEWSAGGNSGAAYYIDLYAIGPKGTNP